MAARGQGKKGGLVKDFRVAATATHPIEEEFNNSDILAEKALKESSKRKIRGAFNPKNNAKYS